MERIPSVTERAAEYLRREILEGRLRPGQAVRQADVSSILGISQGAVREALRMLQAEDLVVVEPRRGARVAPLALNELEEIYGLRAALEPEALRRSAASHAADDVAAVRALLDQLQRVVDDDDRAAYHRLNRDFHFAIFNAGGNSWNGKLLEKLWSASNPYHVLYDSTLDLREMQQEHVAMFDAWRDRRAEDLVALQERHRGHTGAYFHQLSAEIWAAQNPLRVLEVGTGFACAYAGWVLAGQGAQVVRAEASAKARSRRGQQPASWLHRSKSVVAAADYLELLRNSDLVITDSLRSVGPLASLELPRPEGLEKLVVVEIGSPAAAPDAAVKIAAGSGIGAAIGRPDGPAMAPPAHMLEALVALQAVCAGLAAVAGARRDGVGEHVEIDPCECIAGIASVAAIQYLNYGGRMFRDGRSVYKSGGPYPNRLFRAGDGWVVVICRSKDEWKAFLAMLGSPPWAADPRFEDPIVVANHHADEVTQRVEEILAQWKVADLWQRAKEYRVPLAPVRAVEDVIGDTNLVRRDDRGAMEIVPAIERIQNPRRKLAATRFAPRSIDGRQSPRAPLAGLRVLDLGWVWAAPIAAAWLGDLGADVVKVESLERLDTSRRRGLEFPVGGPGGPRPLPGYERAHLFSAANRNKRSVALDVKQPADHARFLELVRRAHVLVESFSGGVLDRMRLSPEQLFEANPNLIILSLGGSTIDGAYASRSYAPILSALAGLEGSVRDSNGEPLGMMGWAQADPNGGTWALLAVLSCLVQGIAGVHLKASQLRGLVNTSAALFFDQAGAIPITDCEAEEITADHVAGKARGPLGDIFRRITLRHWDPTVGERVSFANPWRFRRMDVRVWRGAPLFGSTAYETLIDEWSAV